MFHSLSHAQLDVTRPEQVRRVLEEMRPEIVVNTPGIAVDTCESEPEKGYRIHSWAAEVVGRQCQRRGADFVYISTCGLFGDDVRFYSEYDPVQLKTQYARSKFLGEQLARQACARTFVIRPGWLFGGTSAHQRNFVYQRFLEAQRLPVIKSAVDKFGSPTFTQEPGRHGPEDCRVRGVRPLSCHQLGLRLPVRVCEIQLWKALGWLRR